MIKLENSIKFGSLSTSFEAGMANNITFCVTEECNLRCRYCYLTHKNSLKKMSFETAKKAVDYFLKARDIYNEKSVVWDFIGGEPFLEIDLIDKISDYIKEQMYKTNHPWFDNYMFSFSTNGLLYDTKEVQDYIKKNRRHISIGISVDGNKIKHDMQRVYPDGRGSYDDVLKNVPLWLSQFNHHGTKATFAHDDLPYLKDSIIHLWNIGIKEVAANVIFEDVWDENDPIIFENQLKELADYVIENRIFEKPGYTVRFFEPRTGLPMSPSRNKNRFCGSGKMVAVDCDGNLFPCIRFTEFSLNKQKAYKIGDVNTGVIKDRIKPFKYLSISKMNDEECNNCDVASGCMSCTGFSYDDSDSGTIFKRSKHHCEMHKANVRAIEYFWNKVDKYLGDRPNPRKQARLEYERSFNKYLSIYIDDSAVPHCRYSNFSKKNNIKNKMSDEVIQKALDFAKQNKFMPVFIGLPSKKYFSEPHIVMISPEDYLKNIENIQSFEKSNFALIYNNSKYIDQKIKSNINILHVYKNNLQNLSDNIKKLFENNQAIRVNIILNNIETYDKKDLEIYQAQLEEISDYILKSDRILKVNVLNGLNSEIDSVHGCGCGTRTFAVMPNGKLYVCPGFYFDNLESLGLNKKDLSVGNLDTGLNFDFQNELEVSYSKDCVNCKNFHCDRCVYLNKKLTNEYSISPDIQCEISNIENKIGSKLVKDLSIKQKKLKEEMEEL